MYRDLVQIPIIITIIVIDRPIIMNILCQICKGQRRLIYHAHPFSLRDVHVDS